MRAKDFPRIWPILKGQAETFNIPWIEEDSKDKREPFRVLIACIISLRTQDRVTEEASKRLFQRAGTPDEMLQLRPEEIAALIYPAGFYRTKGQRIHDICAELVKTHNSKVPDDMETLLGLKGVGRKTANLVITAGFNKPGICVDTHVHRLPNRWGLIETITPKETEYALMSIIPKEYWREINRYLVAFGQNICKPLSPWCSRCSILSYCSQRGIQRFR